MERDEPKERYTDEGIEPRHRAYGWEAIAEERIREAMQRGEFDNLPGAGKPLPDLYGPHDDLWWVKKLMKREGLTVVPAPPPSVPRPVRRRNVLFLLAEKAIRRALRR